MMNPLENLTSRKKKKEVYYRNKAQMKLLVVLYL